MRAVDEIARVLALAGRVALLSSCNRGPMPAVITSLLVKSLTGVRVFGRDDLTPCAGRSWSHRRPAARVRRGTVRGRTQARGLTHRFRKARRL